MAPNNTNKGKGNRGARSATPVKPGRQKTERPRRVAGAHSAQTSLRDRFISWRQHHRALSLIHISEPTRQEAM